MGWQRAQGAPGACARLTRRAPDAQRLREAASQGRQAAHAPGTSPAPPSAPLGAAGSEALREFEVRGLSRGARMRRRRRPPRALAAAAGRATAGARARRTSW